MPYIAKKNRKTIWKTIAISLVIVWMVMIFVMSGCSADVSSKQSGIVVELTKKVFNISSNQPHLLVNLTTIVRKCAHAFEYFVLGILFLNAIRQFRSIKHGWTNYWYLAILGALIYAITDEIHQIFIPGRSCELRDIIIDTAAASVGVGIVILLAKWWHRKKREKALKDDQSPIATSKEIQKE